MNAKGFAFLLYAAAVMFAPLSGCSKSPDAASAPVSARPSPRTDEATNGVALTADDVKALGIETTPAAAGAHAPEFAGFGVVLPHELFAQSVADLATAIAVERQSESAYRRSQRLAGTSGALAADVQEAAERQVMVDRAALELAKRRASSTWGQNPPWRGRGIDAELSAIARGEDKVVRVTFPMGVIGDSAPTRLRVARIAAGPSDPGWQSTSVWAAPADANIPGLSFFALLQGSAVNEGERLAAWAADGTAQKGVVIPTSAVIISDGKYWFFVETKPNVFLRTELDPSAPMPEGFFVRRGVTVDAKIVTTSAGLLLARATHPNAAAD